MRIKGDKNNSEIKSDNWSPTLYKEADVANGVSTRGVVIHSFKFRTGPS